MAATVATVADSTRTERRDTRYGALMDAARAEYKAWEQRFEAYLDTIRARVRHNVDRINAERRARAAMHPPCWCGKTARAMGLCENHRSQEYRRRTGRVTGKHLRHRIPDCHPNRPHKALGLCGACYRRTPEAKALARAARRRCRAKKKAAAIPIKKP